VQRGVQEVRFGLLLLVEPCCGGFFYIDCAVYSRVGSSSMIGTKSYDDFEQRYIFLMKIFFSIFVY